MTLTAIIEKGNDGWFTGQLIELPAVISQGKTQEELIENLKDALQIYIAFERDRAKQEKGNKTLIDLVV
jgi:predicted RNase H-like HicB family nuclease